ncbi:hypothetical protein QWY86_05525 [Pedobacter aquatilis]|uniref:hypothetical protein n=1 Tax=Pedobacter aquatilis TaxID=351343 RepID=UPI0025B489F7|nr:hypothetical protein [Pedobacter aquatilis]MDN3586117.1 hypothetical protein [Pedobacter aquatilis]
MRLRPTTQEEHDAIMHGIFDKLEQGEQPDPFEVEIFCTSITRDIRHQFTFCDEYRFRDYYFRNLDYRPVPEHLKMSESDHQQLDEFAQDWYERVVLVTNHSSQTLQHIAKEAIGEIKRMLPEFSRNGFLVKNRLYQHKLKKIMLMSRYIHFKIVYDYFLGMKRPEIIIPSKFGEVIFNDVSLSHIYTRHYAAGEKQYQPDQSFFGPDIHFNSVHRIILLVLGWITKNNIDITQPVNKAISFRFKNEYYQLYLDRTYIQRKGHKGNIHILRVASLFPVNDQTILDHIATLVPHVVSKDLTLFEQNEKPV